MKIEITFAPGCFDEFEGTQEELEAVIAEIQAMVEDGSLFEKATLLSPEEANQILCDQLTKKTLQ